jgi:hypothetical protein
MNCWLEDGCEKALAEWASTAAMTKLVRRSIASSVDQNCILTDMTSENLIEVVVSKNGVPIRLTYKQWSHIFVITAFLTSSPEKIMRRGM